MEILAFIVGILSRPITGAYFLPSLLHCAPTKITSKGITCRAIGIAEMSTRSVVIAACSVSHFILGKCVQT